MLVVLINESEGKAWKRTRRILAKYLPQIGSRVWAGHISEEGLKNLHQDIKKVVSKSGSMACHRMQSRNRMELQWIAGQKALYDENKVAKPFHHSHRSFGAEYFAYKCLEPISLASELNDILCIGKNLGSLF